MKPLIAITAGEFINENEWWIPPVHGQFHTYYDAIVHAGGAPFVLPMIDDESVLKRLYQQADGLLLTGGGDLDPQTYDGPLNKNHKPRGPYDKPISPRRDKQEIKLMRWALRDNKPILGICRGMQLINATLGGSMYNDIETDLPSAHNHEAGISKRDFMHLSHNLKLDPDSQLAKILGTDRVLTNSLHHQAVKRLGKGLTATAHAEDGLIEAIELSHKLFVIGVQSHPEALENKVEPHWRKLFKAFVNHAAGLGPDKRRRRRYTLAK